MNDPASAKIDKRTEPRVFDAVKISVVVVYGSDFKPAHEAARDITLDISEGGLSFYDEWGLPEHVLLEIHLQTSELAKPIVLNGYVRWRRPAPDTHGFTVGVQFVEAGEADREAWLKYVRERQEQKLHGQLYIGHRPEEG